MNNKLISIIFSKKTKAYSTDQFLIELFPLLLMALIITAAIVFNVNHRYPRVGHDYRIHVPRMLDTLLYMKQNGIGIQWYTPSFGGGIPAYPNPLHIQYSLPQFLTFVINPWWSLLISLTVYSILGLISFFLLLRNELMFSKPASILGAIFIIANGFYIEHAVVGHIGYQQFPLLSIILYLILSPRIGLITKGVLIGITSATIVHQAGFYLIIIFILSSFIFFPLLNLLRPGIIKWESLVKSIFAGLVFATLLSSSKLNAVYSFMRFFPREASDVYEISYLKGVAGILIQFLGGFFFIPYFWFTNKSLYDLPAFFRSVTGVSYQYGYGIWEIDNALSPSLLILLILGTNWAIYRLFTRNLKVSKKNVINVFLLLFAVWLAIEFTLAQGVLYNFFKLLPIVKSLHINTRFSSTFIFPLSLLGSYYFDALFKGKKQIVSSRYWRSYLLWQY